MSNHAHNRMNSKKRKNLKKPLSAKIIEAEKKLKTCGTKRFYATEGQAKQSCDSRADWATLNTYKCPFCTGWHVTNKTER